MYFYYLPTMVFRTKRYTRGTDITWPLQHCYYHGQVIPIQHEGSEINSPLPDTPFLIVPQRVSIIFLKYMYLTIFNNATLPSFKTLRHFAQVIQFAGLKLGLMFSGLIVAEFFSKIRFIKRIQPWVVWLSRLSASLRTKGW